MGDLQECPFKGMMAAELSHTDLMDLLNELVTTSSASVVATLDNEITNEDRRTIMLEFEAGRSHVVFVYIMKFSHFGGPPYSVFRMAYIKDEAVAREACLLCMTTNVRHERLAELRREPLYSLCLLWFSGISLYAEDGSFKPEFYDLAVWIAELRFALSSDRPQEGEHARAARVLRSAPNTTEQYISFFSRIEEMQRNIDSDPTAMVSMAHCLQVCSNARQCCFALGLGQHPQVLQHLVDGKLEGNFFVRSSVYSKIIYHADPYTMYTAAAPKLEYRDDADADGDGQVGRPAIAPLRIEDFGLGTGSADPEFRPGPEPEPDDADMDLDAGLDVDRVPYGPADVSDPVDQQLPTTTTALVERNMVDTNWLLAKHEPMSFDRGLDSASFLSKGFRQGTHAAPPRLRAWLADFAPTIHNSHSPCNDHPPRAQGMALFFFAKEIPGHRNSRFAKERSRS